MSLEDLHVFYIVIGGLLVYGLLRNWAAFKREVIVWSLWFDEVSGLGRGRKKRGNKR